MSPLAFVFLGALNPLVASRTLKVWPAPGPAPGPAGLMSPIPAPAPAGSAPPSPEAKDQHYLQQTYAFLRGSSNAVGDNIQDMLGVQTNLDTIGKDLSAEYDHWIHKREALLQQRDDYNKEVAKLQAAIEEQKRMEAERVRLQRQRDLLHQENEQTVISNDEAHKKMLLAITSLQNDVEWMENLVAKSQEGKLGQVNIAAERTAKVRDSNKMLQHQVFHLNTELVQLEDERSKREVNYRKGHAEVLMQIEATQKEIHSFQQQIISQAQLKQQTKEVRRQVVQQADETLRQRQEVIYLQSNCTADLKRRDEQIGAAKQSLQAANVEISRCQAIDAENQQTQIQLNQCNMMKKTSR